MKTSDVVARLYIWLLRLYPRDFQRRFAGDMCADYRDGYAAARRVGIKGSMSFIVRSYWDLAGTLLSQWLETDVFIVWRVSVLVAISIWAAALAVAALEWRQGPSSPSFVLQLAIALVAGSTLTIGIALRHHADHGSG